MRPGVSQETVLYFIDEGYGVYIVELYDLFGHSICDNSCARTDIDYIVNLPISQLSSQQTDGNDSSDPAVGITPAGRIFTVDELAGFLGVRPQYLHSDLGAADNIIKIDDLTYYAYGSILKEVVFISAPYADDDIVHIFCTDPARVTMNGISLDKNRSELIRIFGDPISEGWDDYSGRYLIYFITTCWIEIEMQDPSDPKPYSISFYHA